MKDYKSMSPMAKAMMRETITKKAAKMSPSARKKYIDSLKAKGITPKTIGARTNKNKTYKESILGKTKKPAVGRSKALLAKKQAKKKTR